MGRFQLPDHQQIYFLKKSLCHGIKHHVFDIYCLFGYMMFNGWNKIFCKLVLSFWIVNPESRAAIFLIFFSQKISFNTSNGCFDVLGNMQMWKLPILVFFFYQGPTLTLWTLWTRNPDISGRFLFSHIP